MTETAQEAEKWQKKMEKRDALKAKEAEKEARKKEREALAVKRKNAPPHPPYKDMIIEAIEELKEPRKGVSAPAIKKYIVNKYKVVEPDHHLKMALKTGLEKETFELVKKSYKLGPNAPKKKKKTTEKGKKTTTTKKATTTTTTKKSSTKKTTGSKGKTTGTKASSTKKVAGSKGKKASSTKKVVGSKGKKASSTKKVAGSKGKAAGSKGKK